MTGKTAKVYLTGEEEPLLNVKIVKPNKAVEVQGELTPGQPVDFKISLDNLNLKFSQLDQIEKAEIDVTDIQTKETEKMTFVRKDGILISTIPTKEVKTAFHYDVLFLILLFAVTMVFSQRAMMAMNKKYAAGSSTAANAKINEYFYADNAYIYFCNHSNSGRCSSLSDFKQCFPGCSDFNH